MTDERPSLTEVWEALEGRVLTARGDWAKASCVLHEDRNPSASVNEDTGKWTCHSCNQHGDVYDLLQLAGRASDYKDALEVGKGYGQTSVGGTDYGSGLLKRPKKKREGRKNWRPAWRDL